MKVRVGRTAWCVLTCCIVLAAGCGPSGQAEVYPVKGKVMFNGSPMEGGGSIVLVPTSSEEGASPGGIINEDGTYELSTYEPGDGSKPGTFKVMITQSVSKEPQASPDGSAPVVVAADVPEAKRIPQIYSNMDSPLTATVEAKPNEINFDLKRQ